MNRGAASRRRIKAYREGRERRENEEDLYFHLYKRSSRESRRSTRGSCTIQIETGSLIRSLGINHTHVSMGEHVYF